MLKPGFRFCDVILGLDIDDQLYDNISVNGWHSGYPNANVANITATSDPIPANKSVIREIYDATTKGNI